MAANPPTTPPPPLPQTKLVPCPDCGARLSPAATACPHCGRPMRTPRTVTVTDLLIVLAFVLVAVAGGLLAFGPHGVFR